MSREDGSGIVGRTIQSVDRAMAIVESLGKARDGLSLTELARSLNLAPQTIQSLLRTLQRNRWVVQSAHRGPYCLGPKLGEVHRRWVGGQDRIALASPIVTELSRHMGEYVILAEWAAAGLMPLIEARAERELVVRGELLLPDRIHVMATGKLLLAFLDEPRRQEVVASLPMARRGPNSITDRGELLDQLISIREAGIAICIEEATAAVVSIAVPVRSTSGGAQAALGMALPLARYSRAHARELIAQMQIACQAIAEAWL